MPKLCNRRTYFQNESEPHGVSDSNLHLDSDTKNSDSCVVSGSAQATLCGVASKSLVLFAFSVTVEQVFSSGGKLMHNKARLSNKMLSDLVFLTYDV